MPAKENKIDPKCDAPFNDWLKSHGYTPGYDPQKVRANVTIPFGILRLFDYEVQGAPPP